MRLVVVAFRFLDLQPKIFERIVEWNDIGVAFYIHNALDAAFGNEPLANSAGMSRYIERGTLELYSFLYGVGQHALFGANAIADFTPGAGGDLLDVSYAADDSAVIAFVKRVVAGGDCFSVANSDSCHFCSEAGGLWPEFFEEFEELVVLWGEGH